MSNPLLSTFDTLHQTIPFSTIETEHFMPAFEQAFAHGRQEIAAIIASPENPTFENTVVALEQTGKQLSLVSSILFNLNHAHTSEAIQEAARTVSPMLTQYSNDIWMNKQLFERVQSVYESRHQLTLRVDEQK
ncbi:MAG: M3 family peptidase, partial [Breznakibacter sp.]|nr:M3 family peptidase [Breznakibacter sp.]